MSLIFAARHRNMSYQRHNLNTTSVNMLNS